MHTARIIVRPDAYDSGDTHPLFSRLSTLLMTVSRRFVPLFLCAALLALSACDSGGNGETLVLNANAPLPPTVEYSFSYSPDNVGANGVVEVQSNEADALDNVFRQNGVSRSDVVRARVDSVRLERLSGTGPAARAKVFPYLGGADVYLGQDASGARIASSQFQTTQRIVALDVTTRDVTAILQSGSTPAFLQLQADDPGAIPGIERVRVTVFYTVELRE